MLAVVLQWRLMAAWSRENAIKIEKDYYATEVDIALRSKASQSQVTYTRKNAAPRFTPLHESMQG
jgi:hypothetical protein